MSRIPNHLIIDGFLVKDFHDGLLRFAQENHEAFTPTELQSQGRVAYDFDRRVSWYCNLGLGSLKGEFKGAIRDRLDELFAKVGIHPFPVSRIELELAAHRDGNYFLPHADTFVGDNRDGLQSDRLISAVYYFHSQPKRFSGGELALYPFGPSEPILIEPVDNRLVAFPAFAMHEVKPVACPSNRFADARFTVNVWLRRARSTEGA